MDASDAREHLEMVERIIAASSRKLNAGGEYFIIWGLTSAAISLLLQLVSDGRLPGQTLWSIAAIYALAIGLSVWRGRYYSRAGCERLSALDREFLNVLWIVLGMAFVADVLGFHLFPQWGQAAIWSVAGAVVLFFIGMHGNRRAIVGGIIMIASIAVANFEIAYAGYALAGGMILGYAGFGLADLLARAD